ncbi:hypothetical protein CYMTET_33000 [Cymbomonas tetramitiformis]|uniref:glutamate--tRNA ligase n=1 Tax=Cymbomonas tetramitiformis TaxID=36881 RepID=A0AAE0FE04_9CHLO|nr:hypothetical protein CYMTET_33000 [Cymbomonas tetramitiformis]
MRPAPRCSIQGGLIADEVRVRFAPSPTGNLHVGGARSALFNWLYAKNMGGKFILRVEDTDTARSTRESEEAMLRDLRWLGLDWDEGPDIGGPHGPYRQSERASIYKELADKLVDEGVAYPCFCTDEELEKMREEAEAKKLPPKYNGKWKTASAEEVQAAFDAGLTPCYRFRVPENQIIAIKDAVRGKVQWNTDTLGDFVLLRSNGLPVYNFCVAVDDAMMKITHVLRAEEHLPNTLRQMLVYKALGFPIPQFGHMSLILAPDRSKLSKRHGATSVGDFQKQGFLANAMVNYLSLLGWNDGSEKEVYTIPELQEAFAIDRINKSPAVFDKVKLSWMNGQHLQGLPEAELNVLLGEALVEQGGFKRADGPFVEGLISTVLDKVELVTDAVEEIRPLLGYPLEECLESKPAQAFVEDNLGELVKAVLEAHESGELARVAQEKDWKGWTKGLGKELGRKGKRLFMPLRILITGRMQGPDVGEQLSLLSIGEGEVVEEGLFMTLDERMATLKTVATDKGII